MEKHNVKQFLPFGTLLKDVLLHRSLTGSDLKYLLRERGVFIESNDFNDLVPLLCSTLLSPYEFSNIAEKLRTKEDTPKIITRTVSNWNSPINLIQAVPEKLDLKNLISEIFPRFDISYETSFAPVEKHPNKVKLEFNCVANEYNSSWFRIENEFKGEIELEKLEREKALVMRIIYTSPETKQVADKGLRKLEQFFKEKKYLQDDSSTQRILYSEFDNKERITFLLSLVSGSDLFEFDRITDLNAGPDQAENPPEDFEKLMAGKVRQLTLKGEHLEENFLIRDKSNHEYIELAEIEVLFKFQFGAANGKCKIRYGFFGYFPQRSGNTECAAYITSLSLDGDYPLLNKKRMEMDLLKEFETLKAEKFNWFKAQKISEEYKMLPLPFNSNHPASL